MKATTDRPPSIEYSKYYLFHHKYKYHHYISVDYNTSWGYEPTVAPSVGTSSTEMQDIMQTHAHIHSRTHSFMHTLLWILEQVGYKSHAAITKPARAHGKAPMLN